MRTLELALRLLPVEARPRYREELTAELSGVHGVRRVTYLLGLLLTAPALGSTLRQPRVGLDGHRVRLRCRLGMHQWHQYRTADNQPYWRCDRCGADADGTGQRGVEGGAIASIGGSSIGG